MNVRGTKRKWFVLLLALSFVVFATTPFTLAQVPEWQPYTSYTVGDVVSYNGQLY